MDNLRRAMSCGAVELNITPMEEQAEQNPHLCRHSLAGQEYILGMDKTSVRFRLLAL